MTAILSKPQAIHSRARFGDHSVFVECVATQNSGGMHGFWVDLELINTTDDWEAVTKFLFSTSNQPNAEEYKITDHQIPQFVSLTDICTMIWFVQISSSIDSKQRDVYWAYCTHTNNVASASEFEAAFQGVYNDEADFCYEQAKNSGSNDGRYSDYIDWERVWKGEFNCNGYWAEDVFGGVAIFVGVGK